MEIASLLESIEEEKKSFSDNKLHFVFKWDWEYEKSLNFQKHAHAFVQKHPDHKVLIFCSHPPCFTMGRGLQKKQGKVIDGLVETDVEKGLKYPTYKINRGGGLTFHYPGQIIIYPILKLGGKNPSLSELADLLFQSAAQVIHSQYGVLPEISRGDLIGIWLNDEGVDHKKKIASFGIGIERFITQHGFALNLKQHEIFDYLKSLFPCGLKGSEYSNLESVLLKGEKDSTESIDRDLFTKELVSSLAQQL